MVAKSLKKSNGFGIVDELKNKLVEISVDYLKKNIESSKKEIAGYIEQKIKQNLEVKFKREIKKYTYKSAAFALLGLGGLFLIYSLFGFISYALEFPIFLTNMFFGLFLFLIGLVIWLIYK